MKYLEKNQLITLDDNKNYVVVESIIYEDENFAFLMNPDDIKEQLLVLASKDEDSSLDINIVDLKDKQNSELIDTLVTKFTSNILESLNLEGE